MHELRYYLEMLLGHECNPGGPCAECQSLQRIYQFIQTELFSTVIYTETPIQPRQHPAAESKPSNRNAHQSPSRPHAA